MKPNEQEQEKEEKDFEVRSSLFKRVYGMCSLDDYSKFLKRAKSEGIDPGQAFGTLVKLYANGSISLAKKNKNSSNPQQVKKSFNYAKDRVKLNG